MKHARFVYAVFAFLTLATPAPAQTIPTGEDRQVFSILEKLFVGASENIKLKITDLRRQMARCDGPPNLRLPSDNCSARTLVQAQLNYLLRMGMMLGDPDTEGTAAATPDAPPRPPDPTDYRGLRKALFEKLKSEPPYEIVYVISEDRAKLFIIQHCEVMKDDLFQRSYYLTDAERKALQAAGEKKTTADVLACINEYDPKEVRANRKSAIEYCLQTYNQRTYPYDGGVRFDFCMNTHDMMQAMCKQEVELQTSYAMRRQRGQPWGPQKCQGVQPSPSEIQAIMAAPAARTIADLPAKFLARPPAPPPDPAYPAPAPPVPIPAGTVLETTIDGGVSALTVQQELPITTTLDKPLVINGQTVLQQFTKIFLRGRIIGPGSSPNSVQIGLTSDVTSKQPGQTGGYELKSDELVFTVADRPPAPNLMIPLNTKLRFTIGSSASTVVPSAGASPATPPGRPATVQQPTGAAPAPAAIPPATSGSPPGFEERQKQAERFVACRQQAIKDHPQGGVELVQALNACAQAK